MSQHNRSLTSLPAIPPVEPSSKAMRNNPQYTFIQNFAIYKAFSQVQPHLNPTPSLGLVYRREAQRLVLHHVKWVTVDRARTRSPGCLPPAPGSFPGLPAATCNISTMAQVTWCWLHIFPGTRWKPEYLGMAKNAEGGGERAGRWKEWWRIEIKKVLRRPKRWASCSTIQCVVHRYTR